MPKRFRLSEPDREVILFSLVALLVGLPGIFVFLRILSYLTQPWYYLPLLAVAAVCVDAIFGALTARPCRIARLAVVVILAAATLLPTKRAVRTRLTNVDVVTAQLERIARPGDLILVAPWEYGVGFQRYYRGAAEWMTVPPLELHGFHRYDLLMDLMRLRDQTLPAQLATDWAGKALRTGHRVFVAGQLRAPPPGGQPMVLPPAPLAGRESDGLHERHWSIMVSQFLSQHAVREQHIALRPMGAVSQYEELSLQMLEGWR